jgi:hypothetical protein
MKKAFFGDVLVRIEVSEEHFASIFRVERISEVGTWLAVAAC